MPNKPSCRVCGAPLSALSECPVCLESTSWICTKCESMADVTHTHNCLETVSSNSSTAGH